jgi:hypothetical protein
MAHRLPQLRLRPWSLAWLTGAALALIVGVRVASNYIARDRWSRPSSELAGTKFQFGSATFDIFNETGHDIQLRVSAGGKVLFERRVSANRTEPTPDDHVIGGYHGSFPWAEVTVEGFDTLTRFLEVSETEYLRRALTIDLGAPGDGDSGDHYFIRVTREGFDFRRGMFPS